jgi:PASTA domain-containing protein
VGTNDGGDITLTREGAAVQHLAPGEYTIEVRDRSAIHNFHLSGPGVDRQTTVADVGTTTWNVAFSEGTYLFVCDPHADVMRGGFTVGSGPAPPPPPPPQPPPPAPPPPPPPPAVPPQRTCRVPRVVGKSIGAARAAVRRAGCMVGRVRSARSARPRGRVLRQAPRPGIRVRRGTRVSLVVSRGRR